MYKKGWFVKELKDVQQELKTWPKWKLGQVDEERSEPPKGVKKSQNSSQNLMRGRDR